MKLRNKKTGEIVDFAKSDYLYSKCEKICFANNDGTYLWYYSLADLFEDWEDYEDPKEYWYIDCYGMVLRALYNGNEWDERRKQIGNYFETKEEAEKAVEKLKAWKRLKDKGFRFTGINDNEESQFMIYECGVLCQANIEHRLSKDPDFILLFGEDEE